MPFTEIELKRIENTVGKMCKKRSPVQLRDKLRTSFEIKDYEVIIYEERPRWNDPQEWLNSPIAKFKHIRKDKIWKLYWMRQDMKWHTYFGLNSSKDLEDLVKEVDNDPHGAFWG